MGEIIAVVSGLDHRIIDHRVGAIEPSHHVRVDLTQCVKVHHRKSAYAVRRRFQLLDSGAVGVDRSGGNARCLRQGDISLQRLVGRIALLVDRQLPVDLIAAEQHDSNTYSNEQDTKYPFHANPSSFYHGDNYYPTFSQICHRLYRTFFS